MTELQNMNQSGEITYEKLFEKLGKMKVKKEPHFEEIRDQNNKSAVFPSKARYISELARIKTRVQFM